MNTTTSPWPSFTQEEADAVSRVLLSNNVNYSINGEGKKFEKDFAKWCNVNYAIALANGTVALELALKAINIAHGDEVIVTPRSFIASVSCIVNVGAIPIFADVDLNSGNISANSIKGKLSSKTKAIICVHLAGFPCNMDDIMQLAKKKNLYVIEDCAQAHGAKYKGKPVGSIGDIGCYSFCQDKIMTTGGEGGMVVTNNENFWRKMWAYKDHGKSYQSLFELQPSSNQYHSFGTNWRMTEMQAAIGRIQLKRMDNWHNKRNENAQTILKTCQEFSNLLRVPIIDNYLEHGWYKLYVYVRQEKLSKAWNRNRIIKEISKFGIKCYAGSCSEIYLEKAFDNKYRPNKRLPNAKELGETSIMFLVHPTLTFSDINKTTKAITTVFNLASS